MRLHLSLPKIRTLWWVYTFPCQNFALFASPFSLPISPFLNVHHCGDEIRNAFSLPVVKNALFDPTLCQVVRLFFPSKKWIKLIPKTIGNRKRDCAWGCARGINTTRENLQIAKHKSGRRSFRSPDWFVLCDLQIFPGGVYPPSATERTISFSISNSFWYKLEIEKVLGVMWLGVINFTWKNQQIAKHKSGRRSFSSARGCCVRSAFFFGATQHPLVQQTDLCIAICRFSQVRFIAPSHLTHNSLFLFPIVFGINLYQLSPIPFPSLSCCTYVPYQGQPFTFTISIDHWTAVVFAMLDKPPILLLSLSLSYLSLFLSLSLSLSLSWWQSWQRSFIYNRLIKPTALAHVFFCKNPNLEDCFVDFSFQVVSLWCTGDLSGLLNAIGPPSLRGDQVPELDSSGPTNYCNHWVPEWRRDSVSVFVHHANSASFPCEDLQIQVQTLITKTFSGVDCALK